MLNYNKISILLALSIFVNCFAMENDDSDWQSFKKQLTNFKSNSAFYDDLLSKKSNLKTLSLNKFIQLLINPKDEKEKNISKNLLKKLNNLPNDSDLKFLIKKELTYSQDLFAGEDYSHMFVISDIFAENNNFFKISTDGKIAISSNQDKTLFFWDMENLNSIECFAQKSIESDLVAAQIMPDGSFALTQHLDNSVYVWDLRDKMNLKLRKLTNVIDKNILAACFNIFELKIVIFYSDLKLIRFNIKNINSLNDIKLELDLDFFQVLKKLLSNQGIDVNRNDPMLDQMTIPMIKSMVNPNVLSPNFNYCFVSQQLPGLILNLLADAKEIENKASMGNSLIDQMLDDNVKLQEALEQQAMANYKMKFGFIKSINTAIKANCFSQDEKYLLLLDETGAVNLLDIRFFVGLPFIKMQENPEVFMNYDSGVKITNLLEGSDENANNICSVAFSGDIALIGFKNGKILAYSRNIKLDLDQEILLAKLTFAKQNKESCQEILADEDCKNIFKKFNQNEQEIIIKEFKLEFKNNSNCSIQ